MFFSYEFSERVVVSFLSKHSGSNIVCFLQCSLPHYSCGFPAPLLLRQQKASCSIEKVALEQPIVDNFVFLKIVGVSFSRKWRTR